MAGLERVVERLCPLDAPSLEEIVTESSYLNYPRPSATSSNAEPQSMSVPVAELESMQRELRGLRFEVKRLREYIEAREHGGDPDPPAV